MSKHDLLSGSDVHTVIAATYANAAARAAAIGFGNNASFVASDIGKASLQSDDGSVWLLTATTPVWTSLMATQTLPRILAPARKASAGTITKGQAVYATGWNVAGAYYTIEAAKSDSSSTMPALGVADASITNAANGNVCLRGHVTGLNTSSFAVSDTLYVSSSSAGTLTKTAPTGANLAQPVAVVASVDASNGTINVNPGVVVTTQLNQTGFAEITSDTTTTSTSYVDLLSVTLTTVAGSALLIQFVGNASNTNNGKTINFQLVIDGSAVAKKSAMILTNGVTKAQSVSILYKKTGLSAASHIVKIQWQTDANTAQIKPVTNPDSESASLLVTEVLV